MQSTLSKATLSRLPMYLQFVRCVNTEKISAAQIARGLGLGEVQVRKDLASICTAGLPRVGYPAAALRQDMEKALGVDRPAPAVIVGAGRLGTALMEYDGFSDYGIQIIAAFDRILSILSRSCSGLPHAAADRFLHFAPCAHRHSDGSGIIGPVSCRQNDISRTDRHSQFCAVTNQSAFRRDGASGKHRFIAGLSPCDGRRTAEQGGTVWKPERMTRWTA